MSTVVHLLTLPHTATTRHYSWCAYTEKVRKFADLLTDLGYHVILYAAHENEADVAELVTVVTPDDWDVWWPGEDWAVNTFDGWDPVHTHWSAYNNRTISAIHERIGPDDLIAVTSGVAHKPITDAFPYHIAFEWAVGYQGVYTSSRVFESYAWQSYVYGLKNVTNGQWYDSVIPNWFQPGDFYSSPEPTRDYLLFIGRRITNKGLHIAGQVAKKLDIPLKVAGQGTALASDWDDPNTSYLGVVRGTERIDLFANAIATFVPTFYVEPFGGVAVESMLCGTPVVTTDWGAFPETVRQNISGFRCRTFNEFCEAVRLAPDMDTTLILDWANQNYTHDAVKPLWQAYLDRLVTLKGDDGWYADHPVSFYETH